MGAVWLSEGLRHEHTTSLRIYAPERRLVMEKDDDPKALIANLQERRELLVFLISEYEDRLMFDDLRGDERERSLEELRMLQMQLQSIDTALAEMESSPDL
jgi:hypothetical protein